MHSYAFFFLLGRYFDFLFGFDRLSDGDLFRDIWHLDGVAKIVLWFLKSSCVEFLFSYIFNRGPDFMIPTLGSIVVDCGRWDLPKIK